MDSSGLVAERLLQVIDEGDRNTTYKLALILALIDACAERTGADGTPPETITTQEIAEQVVRIYYPQVAQYAAKHDSSPLHSEPSVLRQIRSREKKAVTVREVEQLRRDAGAFTTPLAARIHQQDLYDKCIAEVEVNFARNPIRRLQKVGESSTPFLYKDVPWTDSVSLGSLRSDGYGRLELLPGVAEELLRLAALIRPLVELHWVRQVAEWNELDLETDKLWGHLFGENRLSFPEPLRTFLHERQSGTCFYCGGSIDVSETHVDHVVPWSRWPNNAIENLVVSDGPCNVSKNDRLLAAEPLDRWAGMIQSDWRVLAEFAQSIGWESDWSRTRSLAITAYRVLPAGTPLWKGTNRMQSEDMDLIRARLRELRRDQ